MLRRAFRLSVRRIASYLENGHPVRLPTRGDLAGTALGIIFCTIVLVLLGIGVLFR